MKRVTVKAPAKLPSVILAWQAPRLEKPAEDGEPYALEVLAGILDGHSSARLPKALVQEGRIAVSVGVGYDPVARGPNLFLADASPVEGKGAEVVESALKVEIERLEAGRYRREGTGQGEGPGPVQPGLPAGFPVLPGHAHRRVETAGLPWQSRQVRFDKLKAVTAEQVQAVANKYRTDDRLTVAVLDPQPLPEGKMPAAAGMGGGHVH